MNNILDKSAEKHAEIHGCWFNRDISGMVKEAADRTGLDIVVEKRYHVGTTLFFELKSKVVTVHSQRLLHPRLSQRPRARDGLVS
jgi:methyltransferase OMS1